MPLIALIALLIALPLFGIAGAWLQLEAQALDLLSQQMQTMLPAYLATSAWLALAVTVGVVMVGAATAVTVSLFEFRGRRFFQWALLLPMAMPAYVSAYAYTDFLQYSGLLQTSLRQLMPGLRLPEIRSLPGAIFLFIFTLYPYTYLLARNALNERGLHLMEAARLLGAPLAARIRRVALPLARPALMAGAALALMETLADYGVGAYFGLSTFTTGIYKAWLVMDNQMAAAQLASVLLAIVALLLWVERKGQQRLRFSSVRGQRSDAPETRLAPLRGGQRLIAWLICGLPIVLGFVLPVLILLRLMWREFLHQESDPYLNSGVDLLRYAGWAWNSSRFGAIAAVLAVAVALALSYVQRTRNLPPFKLWLLRLVTRMAAMGYAVPGSVIAVGILLPLAWLQVLAPQNQIGILVTATALGILYAYLVRFSAVAVQSIEAGYARIPAALDEAARTLGSSGWRIARVLHAPLLWRSMATAFLMVFVDVVKELPATLLLRPFNTDTLAVIAHNLARDERLGEAALPALTIVAVGLIPVLLVTRALSRR
ncbi:iron ABC transporter permease [Collimonas sp.]|jgi:iron(III) transport system permease protein|uniref:ABC transporter permease n=1 Tax=Collimonas sp. TaxID=1963772 RepID=UPI002CC17D5A|nr:iron ABC transporter permease [Collimonas sp.]HWW06501.1 iron ABC transporter permease [Collimonas sp.]